MPTEKIVVAVVAFICHSLGCRVKAIWVKYVMPEIFFSHVQVVSTNCLQLINIRTFLYKFRLIFNPYLYKKSFQQLIRNQTKQVSQPRHINQLNYGPFPAFGFSFYNSECAHALHGKQIK